MDSEAGTQLANGREAVAQLFWVNHFSIKCEYNCARCPVKFEAIGLARKHSRLDTLRTALQRSAHDHPRCVVAVSQTFPHAWTRYVWRYVFMIATDRGTSEIFVVKRNQLGRAREIAGNLCRASASLMTRWLKPPKSQDQHVTRRRLMAAPLPPRAMDRATPWPAAGPGH